MTALAPGDGGRKPLARASINQAPSAVIFHHRDAGHPFDRTHRIIARTWAGISGTKAQTDIVRKANPLLATDLRDIFEHLKPNKPRRLGWCAIDAGFARVRSGGPSSSGSTG